MKKVLILLILIALNFIVYYFLTEKIGINATYIEIVTLLITTIIGIPLCSLVPAFINYKKKLQIHHTYIPFKKIYWNIYVNTSLAFYACMILIAVLTRFKVT